MRWLLPLPLLLLSITPAQAGDDLKTARAVQKEVWQAAGGAAGKPFAAGASADACWAEVAKQLDAVAATKDPVQVAHLLRAKALLAQGKASTSAADLAQELGGIPAETLEKTRDEALTALRGGLSWTRLPLAWARLQRARSASAGMKPLALGGLAEKVRGKPPADLAKQVKALTLQLASGANAPKVLVELKAAREALLRGPAPANAAGADHLVAIKTRCGAIATFLKESPRKAFPNAAPAGGEQRVQIDHIQVGTQIEFLTTMDMATMSMETEEVWTVKAITSKEVIYDIASTTRMQMKNPPPGMKPLKPRTTVTSNQRYPIVFRQPAGRGGGAIKTPKPIGEETIEVSGVKFACKIYENSGIKSWTTTRFPGLVKFEKQGRTTMTKVMVRITSGSKTSARPTTGKTGAGTKPGKGPAADGAPAKLDVSHVKVGQKYHFKSEMDMPTLSVETDMVWTITKVTPTVVEYDLKTTSRTVMKNPPAGMPPMKPIERTTRGQKVPLTGDTTSRMGRDGGKKVGTDKIEVDGEVFPCEIYERSKDIKTWTSQRFPFSIIVEKDNQPLMRLVKIEQP